MPDEVTDHGLPPSMRRAGLPGGDHSLRPRERLRHSEAEKLARAVAGAGGFVTTVAASGVSR